MADSPTRPDPAAAAAPVAPAPDDSDEALLAELEAEQGKAPPAKPAKPAAKAPPKADEDEPTDVVEDEESADGDGEPDEVDDDPDDEEPVADDDEADDEEGDGDDPEDEAGKDPALKKRLDAVRRTEQRQRAQLERERAAFERERSEFQASTRQVTDAQKRFDTLSSRAKYDPAGALEALGLTADDFEYAAQQVYARSKVAAGKKEYREAADRAMREREDRDELKKTRTELDELKKGLTEREQKQALQRELDAYFDRATRKVDDSTPRLKKLLATSPKRARAELAQTALALTEKRGCALSAVKRGDLLAATEKRIVRQLRAFGVDVAAPAAAGDADAAAKPAGKAPPAKPAKPTKGAAAKPVADDDADPDEVSIPTTADLVRELQAAQRN